MELARHWQELETHGFTIVPELYTKGEVDAMISLIAQADVSRETFRKSSDLFAIRQFVKEVPAIMPLVCNATFFELIRQLFGADYFVVKSIYFDKPESSNWYVAYHQDLTISVDRKINLDGFGPWTTKQNQFAVQPPLDILERNFTIRIHLDDTDTNNGALKVVGESHLTQICRPEKVDWAAATETICNVPQGGVMVMKPLLLHGSNRTTNGKRRRVIHLEFSNVDLPGGLQWSERMELEDHSKTAH